MNRRTMPIYSSMIRCSFTGAFLSSIISFLSKAKTHMTPSVFWLSSMKMRALYFNALSMSFSSTPLRIVIYYAPKTFFLQKHCSSRRPNPGTSLKSTFTCLRWSPLETHIFAPWPASIPMRSPSCLEIPNTSTGDHLALIPASSTF